MGLYFLDTCLASMSQIFSHVTAAFADPTAPIMVRVCAQPGVGTSNVHSPTPSPPSIHLTNSPPPLQPPALYICAWKVIDTDIANATQDDIDGGVT